MEAPERIYIHPTLDNLYGMCERSCNNEIEYVHIDVFVKKAINFLEMLGYGFTITDNITHTNYDKEQLVKDFKKYIEGE